MVRNYNAHKLVLCRILALCIIAVCKSVEEEYDYEEEPAAPVTPAPTKPAPGRLGGLLASRGRVNVANLGKKKAPVSPIFYFCIKILYYNVFETNQK